MFYRVDANSVSNMMNTFERFSKALGLEANARKSNVCLADIDRQTKDNFVALLNIEGVPLHSKELNTQDCRMLVDKILSGVKY